MDPSTLPLRDIHLPEPVSWWPLAPGWWLLAAVLASSVLIALMWRRYRAHLSPRRAALAELSLIEQAYATHQDGHACAQALSRLLRRIALLRATTDPTTRSSTDWSTLLSPLTGQPLPAELASVIAHAPYSPAAAAVFDAGAYRAATLALRRWLATLRLPPRQRRPKARSHA